jgi:hypothetical protein
VIRLLFTHSGNNMIGNAWATIAQLCTDDTERWTSRVNGLTDSEVKRFKLNVHWGVRRGAGNSVDASVPLNTDKQLAKEGNMVGVSLK